MRFDKSDAIRRACVACSSYSGCGRHRRYKCMGCKRVRPWSDGAADDMPNHCDECWLAAREAA
jgi:hypothetical protein